MRVLYDYQIFTRQKYGGISRYFFELINRFKEADHRCDVSILISNNIYLNKDSFSNLMVPFPNKQFKGKTRIINFINKSFSIFKLLKSDYDIFHPTYYNPYFLHYCKKPFVLTVHDLIHEKLLYNINTDGYVSDKQKLLERAARIIAISNTTKSDIINIYNINPEKIDVIYHGVNVSFMTCSKPLNINLPRRYVLFVGQRDSYKNFNFFIKAIKTLLIDDESLYLVCTGHAFKIEEQKFLEEEGVSNKVINLMISEVELSYVYNNALCFIFPSIYEGFGMPILEAFAAKTPCLLSDNACFREIASDAALFFKIDDIDNFRYFLMQILYNKALAQSLILKGSKRLTFFSWDKTQVQTLDTYRKAII